MVKINSKELRLYLKPKAEYGVNWIGCHTFMKKAVHYIGAGLVAYWVKVGTGLWLPPPANEVISDFILGVLWARYGNDFNRFCDEAADYICKHHRAIGNISTTNAMRPTNRRHNALPSTSNSSLHV